MAGKKKSGGRKYSKGAGKTVASAMRRKKRGTLRSVETPTSRKSGEKWGTPSFIGLGGPKAHAHSGRGGKGGKVTSRKQAIAIGLSEARKKGARGPEEEGRVAFDLVGSSRCRITCDHDKQVSHECALVRPGHLYGPGIVEMRRVLKC